MMPYMLLTHRLRAALAKPFLPVVFFFAGSLGRANPATLYATNLASVGERLLTLPDSLLLFPGHGPSTTVREEKAHNPFG